MQRVMIIGQPGSGKSTLARLLGAKTGLPVFYVDHIHWQAGWVLRGDAERFAMCRAVHGGERWVFEGGFSQDWPERMARADTLIWLDVPLWRRFWRVLRRTIPHHGQNRPDLPEGCVEGFHAETLEFWSYIWRTRRSGRAKNEKLFKSAPPHVRAFRLETIEEVEAFVERAAAPPSSQPKAASQGAVSPAASA